MRDTLGVEHPDTLACQANLSITLAAMGRTAQSDQIREATLASMAAALGESHPDTVALQAWRRINRDLEPQPI
ncbi:tetratricopeptide repeat protein [Microtetraspora malaysiensis]|uniref:tetratricopeptide repeat protein n=1 Tax=Microtetraspora malaysiensis TaxID=161358 RepID=UPI003D8F984C